MIKLKKWEDFLKPIYDAINTPVSTASRARPDIRGMLDRARSNRGTKGQTPTIKA